MVSVGDGWGNYNWLEWHPWAYIQVQLELVTGQFIMKNIKHKLYPPSCVDTRKEGKKSVG